MPGESGLPEESGTGGPGGNRHRQRVRRKAPRRIHGSPLQRLWADRRARLGAVALASAAMVAWFFAPALQGTRGTVPRPSKQAVKSVNPSSGQGTQVISAFIEDPWRSQSALLLWRDRPGAYLVLQGNAEYQAITYNHLKDRQLWPRDSSRVIRLLPACDTVGLVTHLARLVETWPKPGRITIVTAPTHMDRTMAIARIVYAGTGWQVEGSDADTGDLRPESQLRLWRDQVRATLWRLTGWDGRLDGNDCV